MSSRDLIEQYYCDHRNELLTFVSSRLCGDVATAEDIVQELFLRLLADDSRVIAEKTVACLVFTLARHLITDHYRRLFHRHAYEAYTSISIIDEQSIEPAIYANDMQQHIERHLKRMPQHTADVYLLHLFEGMRIGDIAKTLNQNYKAVEYRLGQARREIRQLFSKEQPIVAAAL